MALRVISLGPRRGGRSGGLLLGTLALEELFEHRGGVVFLVAGPVRERHGTGCDEAPQSFQPLGPLAQLITVAAPELLPLGGVVAEPAPQLGARSHLFEPDVHVGLLFT